MLAVAIVGKRQYGYAPSWCEDAFDLDIARIHECYQVFHDYVDAVFVEISMIAETEQIELETLALDHFLTRYVGNQDFSKIRLSVFRARDEFGTGESDKIFIVRMFIDKMFPALQVHIE